jgi:hypothetical protein
MGNSANLCHRAKLDVSRSLPLTHSQDHLNCAACEKSLMFAVQEQELALMPFSEAAPVWLEMHKLYISPRSRHDYEEHIRRLNSFFAKLPLKDIHWGHIHEYQKFRMQTVSNGKINKECSTVQQIMKAAGTWVKIAPHYKPLPIDREGSGQSLMPEQEQALIYAAEHVSSRATLAGMCVLVMLAFGRGFGELSRLKRRHVDLKLMLLHWPATKTEARARPFQFLNGQSVRSPGFWNAGSDSAEVRQMNLFCPTAQPSWACRPTSRNQWDQ